MIALADESIHLEMRIIMSNVNALHISLEYLVFIEIYYRKTEEKSLGH